MQGNDDGNRVCMVKWNMSEHRATSLDTYMKLRVRKRNTRLCSLPPEKGTSHRNTGKVTFNGWSSSEHLNSQEGQELGTFLLQAYRFISRFLEIGRLPRTSQLHNMSESDHGCSRVQIMVFVKALC